MLSDTADDLGLMLCSLLTELCCACSGSGPLPADIIPVSLLDSERDAANLLDLPDRDVLRPKVRLIAARLRLNHVLLRVTSSLTVA